MSSILNDVKKVVGLSPDYDEFDLDIIMHINTIFSVLEQLGLGPVGGYMITDGTEEWDAFLGDDLRMNSVKTYMYLRVRLLFDPPQTAHAIAATERQIEEFGWRLSVTRENDDWVSPLPLPPDYSIDVIDGGTPFN